jgi:hypothetical protein
MMVQLHCKGPTGKVSRMRDGVAVSMNGPLVHIKCGVRAAIARIIALLNQSRWALRGPR